MGEAKMENGYVLVVEDDREVNELIIRSLKTENINGKSVFNGRDAEQELKTNSYDLVILDLMIPHIDGLELLGRIRKTMQIPVIILSAKGEEADKVIGLGLGADDYITKPFSVNELKARVKAHLRRQFYSKGDSTTTAEEAHSPHLIYHGDMELNLHTYQCTVNGTTYDLKAKEFEILKLFLTNPNRVFTKSQIYQHVWNDQYMEDENTVMVHIRRIRKKIEDDPSDPQRIQTVWGIGYKMGDLS